MKDFVLHINSYLKDRTFYKGMFDAMLSQGVELRVFTPVPYGNRGKADEVGEYVDVKECYHSYERFLFHVKQNKALKLAEKTYDFSKVKAIHAHSMCTNGYLAYKLSEKYGIPYIITVRNGDLNDIYKKLLYLRPLFNRIIQKSSRVVFLSKPYKEDVINNCVPHNIREDLERKSIVIPNGIDDFWLKSVYRDRSEPRIPIKLIYAGEINKNKNLETLVRVVDRMNTEVIATHLDVVGDLKDNSLARLLKSENVTYTKRLSKEELIQKYRDNDIFVMISKREAFGLVYAEALTQGLPIIYTKNQGFDKQFEEGYVGYHVESSDIDEIIQCIKTIISNYKDLSERAEKASQRFSWAEIVKKYVVIYNDLD